MGAYMSYFTRPAVPAITNARWSNSSMFKMIFVVNMDLKMGVGKVAAQVGHATLGTYEKALEYPDGEEAVLLWEHHGARKIVVKGKDTEQLVELQKKARSIGLWTCLIQDAGHTQVKPGSRTVLGVFGEVSEVDQVTSGLKLL